MKKEEPILVAIHCLVYNHEPYLRDCFEGFVKQKTNFRFVAIVHDDVSTDGSAAIIREYAEKYPYIIKPIYETENQWSKPDGSLGRIMDDAIRVTGAKYVAMCEGDDFWTDEYKLQKQVDYMEKHQECVCYAHNSITYNTQSRQIGLFNTKWLQTKDYTLETFITKGWFTPTASLLYRLDAFQLFDDLPPFMHGDYSLQLNLLLKNGSVMHYENEVMSAYRSQGWTSTHFRELDLYNDFIELMKYYKEKSNHRCDSLFDKQIERKQMLIEQYYIRQNEIQKSRSYFVRIGHWMCRKIAAIINRYIYCIHVEKKLIPSSISPLE